MVKKIVMVMLLLTTLVANAYAGTVSDSLRTTLYYRSGYSLLELSYMDNAAKFETVKQGIRSIGDNPNTVLLQYGISMVPRVISSTSLPLSWVQANMALSISR